MLSQVLKKTFNEAQSVHGQRLKMEHGAYGFKKLVDAMLASPAIAQLLRIQSADQLAVSSAEDHEKLAYWMEAFEDEAGAWREGVDSVLGDQKDLLEKEEAENKAAEAQLEADANAQAAGIEAQMGARLGDLGGTSGLDSVEADLKKSSDQAISTQGATAAQDRKYLGQLADQAISTQ